MARPTPRAAAFAAALSLLPAGHAAAQAVDFEASAYVQGKTFWGVDGWGILGTEPPKPEDFRTEAETGNRFARCASAGNMVMTREFPAASGILNITWRWRSADDNPHFCVGAGRAALAPGNNPSALACMEPAGAIGIRGGTATSSKARPWTKGKWHYMRINLDSPRNTFTVFMAADSLRADEGAMLGTAQMADISAAMTRLVFRTQDGTGWADIDDLRWEPVSFWVGGATSLELPDTSFSVAANWNPKSVPDSNSQVVFDGSSLRGCALDRPATVGSLSIAPGFKGRIDLRANALSVPRNISFSGGSWSWFAGGKVTLNGPRGQSAGGLQLNPILPPVVHDGDGVLRLDAPMSFPSFTQTRGSLDFHGNNLTVSGDLLIGNGRPNSLLNLGGRTLAIGGSARFEGTSKDVLLGLNPMQEQPWRIDAVAGKKITADLATIGMSQCGPAKAYATRSVDESGNAGWEFTQGLSFTRNPRDTAVRVGDTAVFTAEISDTAGVVLQWYRDGSALSAASGPTYRLAPVRLKDNGARFSCKAVSPAGSVQSAAATASVTFPVPTIGPAAAALPDSSTVTATSYHSAMRLFLSIDGAAWKERASAVIRPPSEVRAFAVFETDTSATAMRQYAKAAPVTSLAPGGEMVIPAGITLVNPSGASGPVLIDPNIPVSFAAPGFRDVVALFSLSTGDGKAPSPGLGFTLKAGTASSLYRVRDGIFPVDPGSRLTQFGTYFTGVDTAAPVVAWAKDEFLPGDSTRAGFTVRDNTARLTVMLDRAAGGTGTVTSSVASGDTAWLSFKRSAPCVAPFAARVRVLDLRNTTLYPADTGVAHPVAWKSSQPTCTPDLFPAELDADEPWELFSLPMNPESPIRFGTLRDRNAYTHLEGRAWSKEKGYQILDEDQDLAAGKPFWLGWKGSRKASLALPPHAFRPRSGPESRRIDLKTGWNLVGNPGFSVLHWPVSRAGTERYDLSPIKVPHAYDSDIGDWVRSDSLLPWRGYFAFNEGGDTTVTLLAHPLPPRVPKAGTAGVAKRGAARAAGATLDLSNRGVTLRLGTAPGASDGLGPEDEAPPPTPRSRGSRLFAPHAGARLAADIRAWRPGAITAWTGVAAPPSPRAGRPAAAESLRVVGLALPEGHSAWILFRSRGYRALLAEGAAFPLVPGFADSLDVFAGPAALLESRLAGIPESPPGFAAAVRPAPGGKDLQLDLPAAGRIAWALSAPDGRALARKTLDLPAGRLRVGLTPGGSAAGIAVLILDYRPHGRDLAPVRRAFRIVLP